MTDKRDGNWLDESGACKVCDGEIPHGHADHCDIYKLECEARAARQVLEAIKPFITSNTLQIQKWRSLKPEQLDQLFQESYRWYCKLNVENRNK